MSDGNKRAAFRVTEAIRLSFQPVDDDDWVNRLSLLAITAASVHNAKSAVADVSLDIQRKLIAAHRVSETLASTLELLNRKIDTLVDQVVALQQQQGEFTEVPIRTCEISANGVRFSTRQAFTKGDKIHLKLLLVADAFYFEALGEVVRIEADPDNADRRLAAVRFRGIREADKDRLIKHLLGRQSETIRAQRKQLEEVTDAQADADFDDDDI
ncbi:MAG: PilZ domain-containing protein [Pseudomonadota bacterium]